jgi:hypothetical protein
MGKQLLAEIRWLHRPDLSRLRHYQLANNQRYLRISPK